MNVTTDKVINIFPFQFHPRREIVEDDTDSEERNSDEKKSEVLFNEDNQVCPQTEYDHQEQEDAQVEDQHVTSIKLLRIQTPRREIQLRRYQRSLIERSKMHRSVQKPLMNIRMELEINLLHQLNCKVVRNQNRLLHSLCTHWKFEFLTLYYILKCTVQCCLISLGMYSMATLSKYF